MDALLTPELLVQLKELKELQEYQVERLLQQQIYERQMLATERDAFYKSLNNSKINATTLNMDSSAIEYDDMSAVNMSKGILPYSMTTSFIETVDKDITASNQNVNISLDDIPIKTLCSDFNQLLDIKLKDEEINQEPTPQKKRVKTYLKRGEGMTRFKMTRDDIARDNNKMPWLKQKVKNKHLKKIDRDKSINTTQNSSKSKKKIVFNDDLSEPLSKNLELYPHDDVKSIESSQSHKTILNDAQRNYLNLLKQTSIYNNYPITPEKKYLSDTSLLNSPSFSKILNRKEIAEQNMFDLIERKVTNESFSSNSSFVAKATNTSSNTPSENQKYIEENPKILILNPPPSFDTRRNVFNEESSINLHDNDPQYSINDHYDQPNVSNFHERVDSTSESSETDETCRIVLNKDILTSTPNFEHNNNKQENHRLPIFKNNKDVLKIVICSEDTENTLKNQDDTEKGDSVMNFNNDYVSPEMIENMFKSKFEELSKLINQAETEREEFLKEKALAEAKLNEDRVIAEYYLAEEKEKLQKEKQLYDRHIKHMKNHNCKKENEEMNRMQKEISDLKEQIAVKDAKNGATQARLRNQIKLLEKEGANLKEECEKLKKENRRIKTVNSRTHRLTNIKALADINRAITSAVEIEDVYPTNNISNESLSNTKHTNKKQKPMVLKHNMRTRTRSAPNLSITSKYAKYFSKRDEDISNNNDDEEGYGFNNDSDSNNDNENDDLISTNNSKNQLKSPPKELIHIDMDDLYSNGITKMDKTNHKEISLNGILKNAKTQFIMEPKPDPIAFSSKIAGNHRSVLSDDRLRPSTKRIGDMIETVHPDGSIEVKFDNGNHKTISADGSYAKFTFYNGDVKEAFYNDGTTKYHFKKSNIRHTTYKDESELLEFPDGHVERRYKDGTVQAHLPGGARRYIHPGIGEEWRLPDGTVVLVNSKGEQTYRLPNGQTEIHTAEFKKRIYSDGTARILYADGVIETRYTSGRLRVKDRLGNIVMDSIDHKNSFYRKSANSNDT